MLNVCHHTGMAAKGERLPRGAPTPATPPPGINSYGLQAGDTCWYVSFANVRTKVELMVAGSAPIIGLEDLSNGLRSVHTQWGRLVPLVQLGDLW